MTCGALLRTSSSLNGLRKRPRGVQGGGSRNRHQRRTRVREGVRTEKSTAARGTYLQRRRTCTFTAFSLSSRDDMAHATAKSGWRRWGRERENSKCQRPEGEERGAVRVGERENSKFGELPQQRDADAVRRIYAMRPLDGLRSRCVNWARPNRPLNVVAQ